MASHAKPLRLCEVSFRVGVDSLRVTAPSFRLVGLPF